MKEYTYSHMLAVLNKRTYHKQSTKRDLERLKFKVDNKFDMNFELEFRRIMLNDTIK